MAATKSTNLSETLNSLEQTLNLYLGQKAPPLPENIKTLTVKLLPWLITLFFIFTLIASLAVLGISSIATAPFLFPAPKAGLAFGFIGLITAIILFVTLSLEGMALPGLFAKTQKGWRLIYYLTLINTVVNILNLTTGNIGGILMSILSLYFLFQIKNYYK